MLTWFHKDRYHLSRATADLVDPSSPAMPIILAVRDRQASNSSSLSGDVPAAAIIYYRDGEVHAARWSEWATDTPRKSVLSGGDQREVLSFEFGTDKGRRLLEQSKEAGGNVEVLDGCVISQVNGTRVIGCFGTM